MDDCVNMLRQNEETPFDLLLVTQAKSWMVVEQVTHRPCASLLDDEEDAPPTTYMMKSAQRQLQEARQILPFEFQSSCKQLRTSKAPHHGAANTSRQDFALLPLLSAEVVCKEPLLQKKGGRPTKETGPDFRYLESLEVLLTTLEHWFDVIQQVPVEEYPGVPFGMFMQFMQCLMLSFKLGMLDEEGWEKYDARRRIDVLDIMEHVISNYEKLPRYPGVDYESSIDEIGLMPKLPQLLRTMKARFAAEMAQGEAGGGGEEALPEMVIDDDLMMYMSEDPWMTDFLATLQEF
jgi:hypothetical protein